MTEKTTYLMVISIVSLLIAASAIAYTYTVVQNLSWDISTLQADLELANDNLMTFADAMGVTFEEAELIAAAKEEGKVVWYCGATSDTAEALTAMFTEKYGIYCEMYQGSSSVLAARIDQEIEAFGKTRADVVFGDPGALYKYREQGIFMSYESPQEQFMEPEFVDPEHMEHSLGNLALSISYNPEFITEPPTSWWDLTDPKYKGKVVLYDPSKGFYPATLWSYWNRTFGSEFFEKLKLNEPAFSASETEIGLAIAAGEKWIGSGNYDIAKPIILQGASLAFSKPKDFTDHFVCVGSTNSIFEGCDHPNAAKLLIDFCLKKDTNVALYQTLGKNLFFMPVRPDVPLDPYWEAESTADFNFYFITTAQRVAEYDEIVELWKSYFAP